MPQLDWNAAINTLRETLPSAQFQNWVKPVSMLRCNERSVVLGVPNRFHEEWLKANFSRHITQALRKQCGEDLQLEFEILAQEALETRESLDAFVSPVPSSPSAAVPARPALRIVDSAVVDPLPHVAEPEPEPHVTNLPVFNTPFMELDYNRVAYQFSGIFSQGRSTPFQTLIVQGGIGMGKTHLLTEIGRWVQGSNAKARVRYINGEAFGNEFVRALKTNTMHDFKRRYSHETDCLLFDDVHTLTGKEKFQETLLHIFNEIMNRGGRIAFASTTDPRRTEGFIEPLRSRLVSAVIAEIKPPSFEERVGLLARVCEQNQIFVEATTLRCLADKGQKDVRGLIGTLIHAHLQAKLQNLPLDAQFLSGGNELHPEPPREAISMAEIVALVEHNFGVPRSELMSKSRKEGPTWARQVAMYLARTYTLLPLEEIGKTFGRDHATVIHAFQKVKDTMESHPQRRYQVEFLKKKLQGRSPKGNLE